MVWDKAVFLPWRTMVIAAQDGATIALLITAVSGLVLGAVGEWRSRHRDNDAAKASAAAASAAGKDAATRASEAAFAAVQGALEVSLVEVRELRAELATARTEFAEAVAEHRAELATMATEHRIEMSEVRAHVVEVRDEVERCEADKRLLVTRVRDLEMSR